MALLLTVIWLMLLNLCFGVQLVAKDMDILLFRLKFCDCSSVQHDQLATVVALFTGQCLLQTGKRGELWARSHALHAKGKAFNVMAADVRSLAPRRRRPWRTALL